MYDFVRHEHSPLMMKTHMYRWLLLLASLIALPSMAQKDQTDIRVGDRTLILYADLENYEVGSQAIVEWVTESAQIVADYYGGFPVAGASVVLDEFNGGGVIRGRAFGQPVLQVVVEVGKHVSQRQLDRDWIMIHEMIHFAMADLPDKHRWLEEGLPTYIESIARIQAGDLPEEFVWKGFVEFMPRGMPLADEGGLDNARSIGRIYWGGALYCLLADIELHRQTENKLGLQDVLQAFVNNRHTLDKEATIDDLLQLADDYTNTSVLTELYAQMKDEPADINLTALWSALGVNYNHKTGQVILDDAAPLAWIRRSIVSP